jgi:hypothetical protein
MAHSVADDLAPKIELRSSLEDNLLQLAAYRTRILAHPVAVAIPIAGITVPVTLAFTWVAAAATEIG